MKKYKTKKTQRTKIYIFNFIKLTHEALRNGTQILNSNFTPIHTQ